MFLVPEIGKETSSIDTQAVSDLHGDILAISRHFVRAAIPPERLDDAASIQGVRFIQRPIRAQSQQTVSEGAPQINALANHARNVKGQGVKIVVSGDRDGLTGSYTVTVTATPGPLDIGPASKPVSTVASAEVKEARAPAQIQLSTNYPNPFNGSTTLRYILPEASGVRLEVYDLMGQLVRVLVEEWQQAGEYQVAWDGQDGQGRSVSSGVYLYRLVDSNRIEQVRRMLLLR